MTHNPVRAPRGSKLSAKSWQTEAPLRMLMNNLDPEVAERPDDLVVYGGTGRAARSWAAFDAIVAALRDLGSDETLLVQSGKPVGVFRTHEWAPRVLIANSNLVGEWATWEHFRALEAEGLMMYGQMTAGSWIYIGTQGILQGTFETFGAVARKRFGGTLAGTLTLTAGCGGMGGAQPLAVTLNEGVVLIVDVDADRLARRVDHPGLVEPGDRSLALPARRRLGQSARRRQGRSRQHRTSPADPHAHLLAPCYPRRPGAATARRERGSARGSSPGRPYLRAARATSSSLGASRPPAAATAANAAAPSPGATSTLRQPSWTSVTARPSSSASSAVALTQ